MNTDRPRRQAGRRSRRAEGMKWGSPSSSTTAASSSGQSSLTSLPRLSIMICLLVAACCSTTCLSFNVPRQKTQQPPFARTTPLFSEATTINGSSEENVSSNCNNLDLSKIIDDDGDDESSSTTRRLAFKDVAESPAPPLNFEKYLTMQKKRVPMTIRYSAESGFKPYYLTVAKRVKDQYPDVLIEPIEVSGDGNGSEGMDGEANSGTFEVVVDGKIVVRTNQRAGAHPGTIFVSMAEMDLAITRARKRRRPSTSYGENPKVVLATGEIKDEDTVKSRLEVLREKALELQRENNRASATESKD